jgi:hypothetical protein
MRQLQQWYAALLLSAFFLVLAGCGTQPLSQQINTGYEVTEQYVDRTERLYDAKVITKIEAQARVAQAKRAKAGLDAARVALASCIDEVCADARSKFLAAQILMNELEMFLIAKEQK